MAESTDNCAVCAFRDGFLSNGWWVCRHYFFDDEPTQTVWLKKFGPDQYSPSWCPGGEIREGPNGVVANAAKPIGKPLSECQETQK